MSDARDFFGYKHPDASTRAFWHAFYLSLCSGLHVSPETEAELDALDTLEVAADSDVEG